MWGMLRRGSTVWLVLVVSVSAAMSPAAAVGSDAESDQSDGVVESPLAVEDVDPAEAASVAELWGVDEEQARRIVAMQPLIPQFQDRLVDEFPDLVAGVWVDDDGFTVNVALTTPGRAAVDTVAELFPELEVAVVAEDYDHTYLELSQARTAIVDHYGAAARTANGGDVAGVELDETRQRRNH